MNHQNNHRHACAAVFYIFLISGIYIAIAGPLLVNNGIFIPDRIYLYSINFLLCRPETWTELSSGMLAILESGPYSNEDVSVFRFRFEYSDNYLIHAAATCLARAGLSQEALSLDYGTWLYTVVQSGVALTHMFCLGVTLSCIWYARATRAPLIVLLSFVALAYFSTDIPSRNWRLSEIGSIAEQIFQSIVFAISPGHEFDVFGITPRSDATLLLIAVFVLRWVHRFDLAYWTIALISLVHGTYGALAMTIYVTLDVLLRPARLRDWHVTTPIAAVLAMTVLRIQSFEAFEGTAIKIAAIAFAVGALGMLATYKGERLVGYLPTIPYLRSLSPVRAETLLVLVGMVGSVLIAVLLASFSTGLTAKYVAHELSGRPVALLRVPLTLGFFAILCDTSLFRRRNWQPAAVALLALVLVISTAVRTKPVLKSWQTAEEMDNAIRASLENPESPMPTLQLYYVLSCSIDEKCSYMKELLEQSASS